MKLYEAYALFNEHVPATADDEVALEEDWNNYTDMLCKDGDLTDLQYRYCPSYGDFSWGDDEEEATGLLEAMGVTLGTLLIVSTQPHADQFGKDAKHYAFEIKRGSHVMAGHYSQGSAHRNEPSVADIMYVLLAEASGADEEFEEWCDSFGLDSDSRKAERAYWACREIASDLALMFSESELSDLREAFEDF